MFLLCSDSLKFQCILKKNKRNDYWNLYFDHKYNKLGLYHYFIVEVTYFNDMVVFKLDLWH